jgi:hypothetical protein
MRHALEFALPVAPSRRRWGCSASSGLVRRRDPLEVWLLLFKGAFGDWFSWQNTLQRAAPLMLTALCVAIPARAGLTSSAARARWCSAGWPAPAWRMGAAARPTRPAR